MFAHPVLKLSDEQLRGDLAPGGAHTFLRGDSATDLAVKGTLYTGTVLKHDNAGGDRRGQYSAAVCGIWRVMSGMKGVSWAQRCDSEPAIKRFERDNAIQSISSPFSHLGWYLAS